MKAIQIEPSFLPEPPQAPARESQTVATIDNAGYGKQLYKIEQTTGLFGDGDLGICSQIGTCCLRNTTRATFCENVLILCTEQKIMCYPMTYEKVVMPKYMIISCDFRRGGAPRTIKIGIMMMAGSIIFAIPKFMTEDGSQDVSVDLFFVIFILLVLVGFTLVFFACCFKTYSVDLTLRKPPGTKSGTCFTYFFRALTSRLSGPDMLTLMILKEPDKRFIKDYVFGCLSNNMGGYHALSHLIKDDLVSPVRPWTANGAIESTGLKAYVPVAQAVVLGESNLTTPPASSSI